MTSDKPSDKTPQLAYETGNPEKTGVYACRIPDVKMPGFGTDIFLIWMNDKWGYLGSSEWFRGEVIGWIGPLPRLHKKQDEEGCH